MAKKKHIKKNLFKIKKPYIYKVIAFILFVTIIALIAYIVLSIKFKEEIILEEHTPALNVVYKSDVKTQEQDKINIRKEYNNIIKEKVANTVIVLPPVKKVKSKPKLAIIVDDVSFKPQVTTIQSIGYPITMAFLPPTSKHKKSAKIAKNIPFYMIHFPLEAGSFKFAEEKTLKISDSYQTIEQRVQELHLLYPNATFTNNHTGSKFTANKEAMNKLMKALKKYNFTFVDSKTTAKSVAKQTASNYNVPFLSRNIFLDNKKDKTYIQQQLQKAVKVAKEDGNAIAICHPHKLTLQTLKDSKHLLKDVELVLVNQL